MNRIPHKSEFNIRFAFSDTDSLPVSMKGVDFEMWFMTKPGAGVFMAAQRLGICTFCEILDDGSVLVRFDDHHLAPGQLTCDISIHSDDENMPDGKRDIRIKPALPVELVEGVMPGTCHRLPPKVDGGPILVNVRIPFSRPVLSRHVTKTELDDAISQLNSTYEDRYETLSRQVSSVNMSIASDEEIADVTKLFYIQE